MDELVAQITECFAAIKINPFIKDNHLKLISALRSNKALMKDELRQARFSMEDLFHLNEAEWDAWLEDEKESPETLKNYFQLRLNDNPTSSFLWAKFLDLLTSDDSEYESILNKALQATTYDIQDNHLIVKRAIHYYETKDADAIRQVVLSLLKVPHSAISDTLSYYSSYISKTQPDQYEQEMISARDVSKGTMKFLDFIETKEVESINNGQNAQFWISYLHTKGSKEFKSVPVLVSLFERAVRGQESEEFIPLWESIIELLYEFEASPQQVRNILSRYVKRYPGHCQSWTRYVRDLEFNELPNFITARERILGTKLLPQKSIPFSDKKPLLMSLLSFISKADCVDDFADDIDFYFNYSMKQNDPMFSVEKLTIQVCGKYRLTDRDYFRRLTADDFHGSHADVWLFRMSHEAEHGDKVSIFKFFKESIVAAQHVDYPTKIFDEIKRYSCLRYDAITDSKISKLINKTSENIQKSKISTKRIHTDDESDQEVEHFDAQEDIKKRPRTADLKSRDREHLTVLVKNLPADIKGTQLRVFFKGCDPINNINIIKKGDSSVEASVEFGTTQAMLSALTKNYKRIGNHELQVEQAFNTTVWVTNFPPDADKVWLENLFSKHGKVASVRLPSLKANATRRFCYIEYTSSSAASEAVAQLDGKEIEGFELTVKISNPEAKQPRSGAIEEGREVYVCKIDFNKTTPEKLRQVFEKFGEIEKIYLPLSNRNKTTGRLHDGYGFVTFAKAEEATKSLELNGVNLDGRIIEVSIAQPRSKTRSIIKSNSEASNTVDTIKSKTLTVSNLPDTINASRLKSFFEQIGPIRKVDLNTELNSAIIEFEKVADAGIASMKLIGAEIDGNEIELGSRWGHDKKKASVVDAPKPNRRERRLALQQAKAKEDTDVKMEESKEPLSNADFRAMLLGKK